MILRNITNGMAAHNLKQVRKYRTIVVPDEEDYDKTKFEVVINNVVQEVKVVVEKKIKVKKIKKIKKNKYGDD